MCYQAGRKGVKGLSLVGHEGVPCGLGLRTGYHLTQLMVLGTLGKPAQLSMDDRGELGV